MAFTPRTRAQIASEFLAFWSSYYAAASPSRVLLTAPGSDADLEAQALAVELEGVEASAYQTSLDILPDQASPSALDRFGYVYNVPRKTGTIAQRSAQVTGAASGTTYPIPSGTQAASSSGVLFNVVESSVTTDGSNHATITLHAVDVGTEGNLDVGETVTFTIAPSGLNPTAPITAVIADGEGVEDDAALAARIIARLRERPASGNRADWREWVLSYIGTTIDEAYIYPLLQPPASTPGAGTESVLGCVTVVAVGPAQGTSTTNTRIVPSASFRTPGGPVLEIIDFLNGVRDNEGNGTLTGERLPPVTMAYGDWTVEAINTQVQNVTIAITPTASNAFPFTSTPTIDASSTSSSVVVSGNYAAGGIEDLSGLTALVRLNTTDARGGYVLTTLGTGTYNGGTLLTTFPLATALAGTPVAVSTLRPAPPCWSALQSAVFAYFDGLGPGDTATPCRWPPEGTSGRSILYRSALAGVCTEVSGVLSASITTPVGNVTPAAKTVVTLGVLMVTP